MPLSSKLVPLAENIFLLPGRRGGRYPHCNSVYIDSGDGAVIDPGSDRKELRRLAEAGVGLVLLSHFHSDHLREIRELPSSRLMVHEIERGAVEGFEGMASLVWFPEETKDRTWISRKDREVGGWGWPVHSTFSGGERIMVGDIDVCVYHAPGHTPGHCMFLFPEQRILYSADIDLTGFGPWYGNAASDIRSFLDSIALLRSLQPETVVTGHEAGVVRENIEERLDHYAGIINTRQERILDFLSRPRSLEEVVEQGFIYGGFFSKTNSFYDPEWRMVRHHLKWGLDNAEVRKEGGGFVRYRP